MKAPWSRKPIKVLGPKGGLREAWALLRTLRSGWWGKGPKVERLERRFAEVVGKRHAIAVDSCTSALDLCVKAMGIGGGELITTPLTFCSPAMVGLYNGLDVTFGDVDPLTLCLDPEALEVTDRTTAVIVVHSHGCVADVHGIRERFGGPIIEDCAHAMYSRGVGAGDVQCWSFQAVKTMPAGDGGMITCDDDELADRIRPMTWMGIRETTWDRARNGAYSWDYDIDDVGYKSNMNDLTATVALCQLDRLERNNARRRAIARMYDEGLDVPSEDLPAFSETVQYYTLKVDHRDGIAAALADRGISTSVHFKPLDRYRLFEHCRRRSLPVTDEVWPRLLTLPVQQDLSDRQVRRVIRAFNEARRTLR